MIKPDWNTFKAKFSENPQYNFEWLCYLLFCDEYGKGTGIFRYKNQSAIETDPIEIDGESIGWQSKFYETALTQHKDEMLGMIKKAKRDYPGISKLYLYTNSEWGQYRGKEPAGKKEIEVEARNLSIELIWRCKSYFESPFVVRDNKEVASYFFSFDNGIFDLIDTLNQHTENILNEIGTSIEYRERKVTIDRSKVVNRVSKHLGQVFILSGDGGVGKTAVVKSLYEAREVGSPFYIHKATEFDIKNISEILSGNSLEEFVKAHDDIENKVVVIDSAENLLCVDNSEPFKEYISTLLKNNWKLLLTTRNSYLDDLVYQFFEIYKVGYEVVNIKDLSQDELNGLSDKYDFKLPHDQKLLNFIKNPFYLKEYLRFYEDELELNYIDFKDSLWNRVIRKGHPGREQAFLRMAVKRANEGSFFVIPENGLDVNILEKELMTDGIIGYESPHGYFITHDIYEEWALEKYLESEFIGSRDSESFLNEIKQSLPVRRMFRRWVSEKLCMEDNSIQQFIQDSFNTVFSGSIWNDEIIISVLLSDYSDVFFRIYKDRLIEDDCFLLKKASFLLRIACKEIDDEFFKKIGIRITSIFTIEYALTKPKGSGWSSLIKFVYDNFSIIGADKVQFILPIISDWNKNNRSGETTRLSSLMALKYYEWLYEEDIYVSDDEVTKSILLTIVYGAREITKELGDILDLVVKHGWKNHRDPYQLLSSYILTKMECFEVASILPERVINLARLYWTYIPDEDAGCYGYTSHEVDNYFGLEEGHQNYFPASAYQTPIYYLLQTEIKVALDFIIEFTNYAVKIYAESSLDEGQVKKVKVKINDNQVIEQDISNRLWCMYRGTQVNADVLESMHMSLERYLLNIAKEAAESELETILIYLLSRTHSASISGVVASIVTAYPEKTFKVASILFRTKDFFKYDTTRYVLDQSHKSQLVSLRKNFGINRLNEIHENERINACDDKHRSISLENILLNYQLFRDEGTSEEKAKERLEEIWKILDEYYLDLPDKSKELDSDKVWRLYLARMDKRKMSPSTKEVDGGLMVNLNPEIDDDLREYSDKSLTKSNEPFIYAQLSSWVNCKLYGREGSEKYKVYESNPLKALDEARMIWSDISNGENVVALQFNRSLPSEVCMVMLRDYQEELNEEDMLFCKDIMLFYASLFLQDNYVYQVSDGVLPAIVILPKIFELYPEESENIKYIIILALLRHDSIDISGTNFNSIAIGAVQSLWENNKTDALSLYIGYLLISQKEKDAFLEYRSTARKENNYSIERDKFYAGFLEDNSDVFSQIMDHSIQDCLITDLQEKDIEFLVVAFQLVPNKNVYANDIPYVDGIISVVAKKILSNNREEKINYSSRVNFLKKYTQYVLNLPVEEIESNLKPFINGFTVGDGIADLLKEFISSEDVLDKPDAFWKVWDIFKPKIKEIGKKGNGYHYLDKIIESYLFSRNLWKDDACEWHSFKNEQNIFFREITHELGCMSSCIYSISKLLDGLGSSYLDDGVIWLSSALNANTVSLSKDHRENTIYYLERIVKKYIFKNREKVRKVIKAKSDVLVILDFLIGHGSVIGYLLREDIV